MLHLLLFIFLFPGQKRLTDGECTDILNFSGNGPLAIRLISRTIQLYSVEGMTIKEMLDMVQLMEAMSQITKIIEYTYNRLDVVTKEDLLRISVFGNSVFETDEVAFITEKSIKDTILTLMLLKYRNLIEIEENILQKGGLQLRYHFHPLVLNFLSKLKKSNDTSSRLYLELMIKKIENVESTHNERLDEALSIFRSRKGSIQLLFSHLQNMPSAFDITRSSFLNKLSIFLGSAAEREKILIRLTKEHRLKGFKTSALYWVVVTATTYMDNSRIDGAEQQLQGVKDEVENVTATDHELQYIHAEYYLTKARIYHNSGKYNESEEYLHKAEHLYLQSGAVSQRFTELARTLNALGNVYYKRKDYSEAARYHQEACDIMKQHLIDMNNQDLTVYIFNLGTVKAQEAELLRESNRDLANQKYSEALFDFNTSLEMDINLNLKSLPNFPMKLLQRSSLHHRMGQYKEAIADAEAVIKLREEIYDKYHFLVTEAYFNFARLLYKRYMDNTQGTQGNLLVSIFNQFLSGRLFYHPLWTHSFPI